jgi:hypothetical protein
MKLARIAAASWIWSNLTVAHNEGKHIVQFHHPNILSAEQFRSTFLILKSNYMSFINEIAFILTCFGRKV